MRCLRLPTLLALLVASGSVCADWPPPAPSAIVLTAPDASGIVRAGDLAVGGVPLARTAGVVDPTRLRLVNAEGIEVPAQFRVLARWNAARNDASAPIQWVLAEAPAPATGGTLRLRADAVPGAPAAPATPLSVVSAGGRYTIDTGAARFVIHKSRVRSCFATCCGKRGLTSLVTSPQKPGPPQTRRTRRD